MTHRMMPSEPVIAVQEGGLEIKIGSSVTVFTWWLSNRLKKTSSSKQDHQGTACICCAAPSCLWCWPNKGICTLASSQRHGQDHRGHGMASQQQLIKWPGSLQPGKEITGRIKKMRNLLNCESHRKVSRKGLFF